jgi:hypothetical protein
MLLFQLTVIHDQDQIVIALFDVHLAQGEAEWAFHMKLLGLVHLKLVIIALTALLKRR